MKKIKLVLLIVLCYQLNGISQFKEITAGQVTIPSEVQITKPEVDVQDARNSKGIDYKIFGNQSFNYGEPLVFVSAWSNGRPIAIDRTKSALQENETLENQVASFLNEVATALDIEDISSELLKTSQTQDQYGQEHYKYDQVYKGIPILESGIIVHADNNMVSSLNGNTFPTPELPSLIPLFTESAVKELIYQETPPSPFNAAQRRFMGAQWEAELVIYHVDRNLDQEKLCWSIEYRPNVVDRWFYIVDATTGETIKKYSGVCKFHAHGNCDHEIDSATAEKEIAIAVPPRTAVAQDLLNNNVTLNTFEENGNFYLIDASRSMFQDAGASVFDSEGVIVTLDAQNTSPENNDFSYVDVSSSNNSWSDQTAVSAHSNGGQSYQYFESTFNRNSINGNGGDVISLIHVSDQNGNGMDNAFWNGAAMWYGDGAQAFFPLARGLDVAGHEISHGVVQSTANLTYQGESGALNESFADVFGAMIDRDDWRMGEDVVKVAAFPSGALRNLQDPHNGASTGNFGAGWQPKHVNEQFTGTQDNGGVHINSGIPNHAYYLFATAVGKDKAEQVWYSALVNFLTASSQFVDLRIATVKAAEAIHGMGSTEVQALKTAMDQVGILDGAGGTYEEDINVNPGEDFLLMTSINNENIYIYDFNNQPVQISDLDPISKPSITDNGEEIVFIASDNRMHYIRLNWDGNTIVSATPTVLQTDPVWRNAVISKDGFRLAALYDNVGEEDENLLFVYDFDLMDGVNLELTNPTTTSTGNTTKDVRYADAMEFDISGDWIMYDALNELNSGTGTSDSYWDISFIKVWNSAFDTWTLGGEVSKLFSSLPDGVNVGNPTFSKNSPYIIAFEYITGNNFEMRGYNLENGDFGTLKLQDGIGYPSYSRTDEFVIYDNLTIAQQPGLDVSEVSADKLSAAMPALLVEDFRWGVWFGNADRFSSVADLDQLSDLSIFPNPTTQQFNLSMESDEQRQLSVDIYNSISQKIYGNTFLLNQGANQLSIDLPEGLTPGNYFVRLSQEDKTGTMILQVQR